MPASVTSQPDMVTVISLALSPCVWTHAHVGAHFSPMTTFGVDGTGA